MFFLNEYYDIYDILCYRLVIWCIIFIYTHYIHRLQVGFMPIFCQSSQTAISGHA